MITLEAIQDLYDYGYWARDQQLAACLRLSNEDLDRPVGGSFGSIQQTLRHLLGAEYAWLERFNGRSPRSVPWLDQTRTLDEMRVRWGEVERGMRACLASLTRERITTALTYQNFKGETCTYPFWQALLHLANHGTYHRGQVTMALRMLGVQAPAIDLLVYYDQSSRGVAQWQSSDSR